MHERFKNFYKKFTKSLEKLKNDKVDNQVINGTENNNISEITSSRDFTKLVRKLDNKLWLDPQISMERNGTQADALKNFKTISNALSVFIADDQDKLTRILAAIAAGGSKPDKVDYAIFDAIILERNGIHYEKCPGDTADEEVNKLHVDLKNLTAVQVSSLAQSIKDEGNLNRLSKTKIIKAITDGLNNNFLNRENVRVKDQDLN